MDIVERARLFATAAHAAVGQRRKYTNEPYIVHPQEVAEIVFRVPHNEAMLAAAWLHDVVEDTQVTHYDLIREFGDEVSNLVFWLTDISKPEDGNRERRKMLDRLHIAGAPSSAQTIKLADTISNLKSIGEHDPEFALVYFEEKRLLVEQSLSAGNHTLRNQALKLINEFFQSQSS